MRAILFILILAILILIGLFATGLLHLQQTRPAQLPSVSSNGTSVTTRGGQTPAFDVETGKVVIGSKPATVKVPALTVERGGQPAGNGATTSTTTTTTTNAQ
ncbi:hypothetical protein HMF7854_02935 [Sphingomonas ginkgonis]|uniref:Uncharacterized protein n=1 Tax=Sphingomonas ginkgonis TaxID=2315330 RepID=A0A429V7L6_9SPHN|nr:hypothetical protein [Sphingomonas ginkgonis]RST29892.1 hypothetical protein HMF7854_02935 [Sphingomonas ginkgonis]